jgi:D-beta-D-heptose 7-phosphate kinase / D-beta-D-heptose 1-phosphate adenosyltransferase
MSLVVVGDALLDRDLDGRAERLAPDAPVPVVDAIVERPRPGGAGLAAALAAAAGPPVTLVCALGDDAAGRRLARLLEEAGVRLCDLGLHGPTPEKVRVRAGGRAIVRLDSGGGGGCGPPTDAAARALRGAAAVLVSDYGRGVAAEPSVRAALAALTVPVVWDPHPNGPGPVPGVVLATPNEREALVAAHDSSGSAAVHESSGPAAADDSSGPTAGDSSGPTRGSLAAAEAAARALAARWRAVHVCVTRGAAGAVLVGGAGPALAVPAPRVPVADPCGAGDSFAAAAAVRLAAGALPSEAVTAAVHAASAFVAAGGAAGAAAPAPPPPPQRAAEVAERVRSAGGTVVATGGCFDLLHAGHVRMLESARALGDCLIVCLNSDASVRRLKGEDRPLVGEHDRAAVLAGLGCVDAVATFDEDDPSSILRDIRPDVWAKGGDYAVADLPEAGVIAAWGGRAVIVPYVSGRSTTRLIEVARGATSRPMEVARGR